MFISLLARSSCRVLFASLAVAPLFAQVPVAISLVGDHAMSTTSPVGTSGVSEPAGAAANVVTRGYHVAGHGGGSFQWAAETGFPHPAMQTSIRGSMTLGVFGPNVTTQKPQSDLLVTLTPGVAMQVRIEATRELNLYGTNQQPLWQVDVGNNGIYEYDNGMGQLPILSRTIGPQPYQIRIRTAAILQQQGTMSFSYRLRITPDSGVGVTPAMPGCAALDVPVVPIFPNAGADVLWLGLPPWPWLPLHLGVLGLGLSPVLLPTPLAVAPNCLLLPSPDLTFLVTPQATTLAIPAAVRPVQLWAQCVSLEPAGLGTTNGYRIDAQ